MKKFLSLVLALVMTMSLVTVSAGAQDFNDSDKINYDEAVDVMSALKIIDGYSDGDFRPDGTLTRGAAAKIIACMMLGKTTAESLGTQAAPFKDVPVGSTFAGYIAYCVESGLIDGYADGTFRPQNTLTGFAFLKMLLGALGYDSTVEGFTGSNWTVNVARLAIENGLTDGNDDFVGTRPATREEACLYAVNALQATLVEYADKGSSITINGAEIVTGASKATIITTKTLATQTISNAMTTDGFYSVEFAEKYQPKLVLTGESDAFSRPANVWTYEGKEVGTYTKDADLTYTTKQTSGDIYADLGLTRATTVTEYYVDGEKQSPVLLEKGNTVDANKVGGQGVETTVYYDTVSGDVTICEVNTYVADVVAKYSATSSRDAYIILGQRDSNAVAMGGTNPYADLLNFSSHNTYETTDFAVDDIVLFTYSNKTGDVGIQDVFAAETVKGELTNYTTNKQAVVGGNTYKYAEKIAYQADAAFLNKNVEATVVLDQYGNAIDVTDNGVENYAVVLKLKNNAGDYNDTPKADLLLTDGTVVEGVNLTNDAGTLAYNASVKDDRWVASTNEIEIDAGDIVSYTINNRDKYTLTRLAAEDKTNLSISNGSALVSGATKYTTTLNGTKADTTNDLGTSYTANGKTIFLVVSGTLSDPIYSAYTGIKDVPSISATSATTNAVYCKTGSIATVVYVDVRGTANISTNDVIFVKSSGSAKTTVDTVSGTYYIYDAIVNGEITTINSKAPVNENTLFDSVSYTTYSNGVNVANLVGGVSKTGTTSTISGNNGIAYTTQTDKLTNGAIGLGSNQWYVPADNCEVFYIDADGTIQQSSVNAIAKDTDDEVFFKMVNGEVTSIVVNALPKNSGNTPVVNPNVQVVDADAGNGYANPTFYIASGATLSTMEMREALNAKMIADGCSNISWNGSTVTFTKSGYQYSTSVTLTQVYEVKLASAYGVNINVGYVAASKDLTVVLGNGVLGTNWTGATNTNINVVTDNGISFSVKSATAAADGQSITVVLTAPAAMKDTSATLSYK